jgi:catechol 2,3-dioxygenase-like lactoylglutathione lyase family enzyme
MKFFLCFALSAGIIFAASAYAQLTPFNNLGVTNGHVHILTPDPETHKKLFIDLFGAQVAHAGALEILKLPGTVILIMKAQLTETGGQPTCDHFALAVRDLGAMKQKFAAAKISIDEKSMALFPDGVKIELIENKGLSVPVAFHHYHLISQNPEELQKWYEKYFGIKFPDGQGFPGGAVYFKGQSSPSRVPTKGHSLDHIGFEVKNLDEICKKFEADGVKMDTAIISAQQIGLRVAFVTDPAGTRIELTEGLWNK